jgi:hypothetical protein
MCIVDDGANERVLCDLGEARRCQARRDGRVVERRWQRVLRRCWAAVEGGACAPGVLDGAFVVHLRSEAEAEAAHVVRSALTICGCGGRSAPSRTRLPFICTPEMGFRSHRHGLSDE